MKRVYKNEVVSNFTGLDVWHYLDDFKKRGLDLSKMRFKINDQIEVRAMSIIVDEENNGNPVLNLSPISSDEVLNEHLQDLLDKLS